MREDYGRNAGGEFNGNTPDGKWQALGGYMHSLKNGISGKNGQIYGRLAYSGTQFLTFLEVQNMGENYFADMGFNPRIENYNPETYMLSKTTEFGLFHETRQAARLSMNLLSNGAP